MTCGDITDATPADFYAHQTDRENSQAILGDLRSSAVNILMGSGNESVNNVAILQAPDKVNYSVSLLKELQSKYRITAAVDSVPDVPSVKVVNGSGSGNGQRAGNGTQFGNGTFSQNWIVVEKQAGLSMLNGRGDWLQRAFSKTVNLLSSNKAGFFLMTEGAQVDYGGHANNLPYVVTEVMDFDQVVGKALQFADQDGETLVIVTADHETGGLSLLDGNYTKGAIFGQFSTNDHTGVPVPVFAYGPRSGLFRGVYENTEIFKKILQAYGR